MWVWLSLLLGAWSVEATSNGVGMACNVDLPNLGSTNRQTKSNNTMWWVWPPQFAGTQYTLRTADPSTSSDPNKYLPGQWINIYIRTTGQDQQFTGLILYAVNSQNKKVGEWQVPANAPYLVMPNEPCVAHSNADPKNYLSVFKFKGPPAGTGPVTIKALVKFGLAFPNPTGMFFWPNNAHLVLSEGAPMAGGWYEGAVGESCITTCVKRGLGCDLATMRAQGNSPNVLAKVAHLTNCSGPLMPGCSAASPSVGSAGCFYHSDTCIQPPPALPWVRRDPCAGLSAWVRGTIYCQSSTKDCVKHNGAKYCCNYYNTEEPGTGGQYGAWGTGNAPPLGNCTEGLPPVTVPIPARTNPGAKPITCEATKNNVADGGRICACSFDGQRVANGASSLMMPLAAVLFPLVASFY